MNSFKKLIWDVRERLFKVISDFVSPQVQLQVDFYSNINEHRTIFMQRMDLIVFHIYAYIMLPSSVEAETTCKSIC